jgi:hypothetical protein
MSRLDNQFDEVLDIVRVVGDIEQRAALQYRPVVVDILRTDCRDAQHIESALSGMLDFCGDDTVLSMYRQLCRHYWAIDQAATAFYINAYREIWDSEELEGPVA